VSDSPVSTDHSFAAWRAAHFTPAQLADASVSGPAAAPLGDGHPNLLKYHLGLSPWAPLPPDALVPELVGDTLALVYRRSRYAPDAAAQVEWSADLVEWSPTGVSTEVLSRTTTHEDLRASVSLAGRARLFLRLRVGENP
jgi:hypothetical protein